MKEQLKRFLIFGGTFDPPHLAHTKLPVLAAEELQCDRILFIPTSINPLKAGDPPTSAEHRLAMLTLAIADIPNAHICTLELESDRPSYTINTLRQLRKKYGESTEFRLLIGCDHALQFHQWKDWREILNLSTPAVMIRPPWTRESLEVELTTMYSKNEANQWIKWTVRIPKLEISAQQIRPLLRHGESVNGLLDSSVTEYIRKNQLYQAIVK